jgi:hypothetical protein
MTAPFFAVVESPGVERVIIRATPARDASIRLSKGQRKQQEREAVLRVLGRLAPHA